MSAAPTRLPAGSAGSAHAPAVGPAAVTDEQIRWFAQTFDSLVANVERAILGKEHVTRLALTCLLSEGHLLLEDYPGTGKTQLARPSRTASRAVTAGSSSPPTCCPPTSPG
jgi:hypothetical protein